MPTGDPPPHPPPPGIPPTAMAGLISSRNDALDQVDASMDVSMNASSDPPAPRPIPSKPAAPPIDDSPPLQFLKNLAADPNRKNQNGTVGLDAASMAFLIQLVANEAEQKRQLQLIIEDLRDIRARLTTIEAGQLTRTGPLTRPPPAITKSYATTAAKTGTAPLKEADAESVVRKTNDVLEKLDANIQGEKVVIKAVRFLPSGDVSFYSKNRHHKEWLNKNKHVWSKQVHPDLEATPSTYSILAHGIPRNFNVEGATGKITIASHNQFIVDKIFKMRWLGGSRDPADPRQAGTVVIAFTDPDIADALVKQRGLFLNGSFHRVERFKKLPPQCFKCLQMGHFGKWCRADPKCGKCGGKHETRDCQQQTETAGKVCVVCRDNGKDTEVWGSHTPFDKACGVKRAWLISKNHIRHE
ncbi:hypothetical protein PTTG_28021 [Puccinia triticina 1-1 BBBD Race 1]|uniref:CCHC-type domain-containing protein n=1 Tax=Puccinia triticina (isolate 1-1 / race 1 (BBBD)) TaxID=630390 RepID=A0A180GF28_PUCT1|nr:hypothetical protein PTTG_28021 [Puccinia triticina 1-1 BBBD Race 1]